MTIERAMRQAKASIEISGLRITPEQEELVKLIVSKQITEEEFKKMALDLIKNRKQN